MPERKKKPGRRREMKSEGGRGPALGGGSRGGRKPRPGQKRGGEQVVEDRVPTKNPAEFTDKARGERIQKVMADAGVASRRDCETLVRKGRVFVNGKRLGVLPAWVDPVKDRVEVNGEWINPPKGRGWKKTGSDRKVYVMLHKPRRVISTAEDDQDRQTVLDLVSIEDGLPGGVRRLYPVGRLDSDSTGLILLTNDGELTERLTHPRNEVAKAYRVTVRGVLSEEDMETLRKGVYLANQRRGRQTGVPQAKRAAMAQVKRLGVQKDRARGDRTVLGVVLKEGQNREIRRLLARLGFKVLRLHRTAIGPLRLKGLAKGEWRLLEAGELRALKREAGMK